MHRTLPFLATLAFLTSCSDGPAALPDVTGRYALVSVNGNPLPYLWTEGQHTEEWLESAALTLRADGAFMYEAHWRTTYAGGQPDSHTTFTLEGDYVVRGSGLRFTTAGELWADGTLGGDGLTVIGENFVANVFVRQ